MTPTLSVLTLPLLRSQLVGHVQRLGCTCRPLRWVFIYPGPDGQWAGEVAHQPGCPTAPVGSDG